MQYKSFLDMFEDYFKHNKINKRLYGRVEDFKLAWEVKCDDNINFLGGNTLGVHMPKFSSKDDSNLMEGLFNLDIEDLRSDIDSFKRDNYKEVKQAIPSTLTVGANPIYLTLMYLIHFAKRNISNKKHQEEIVADLYLIFAYKAFFSITNEYFHFRLDDSIAIVVFEKMSKKFNLKKLNSWNNFFDYRAQDVSLKGLHHDTLYKFKDNYEITKVIADLQGRLRSTIQEVMGLSMNALKNKDSIRKTSLERVNEDGKELKDVQIEEIELVRELESCTAIENDYIKNELVHVIDGIMNTTNEKTIKMVLRYISFNYLQDKELREAIELSLVSSIEYINENSLGGDISKNIDVILIKLKNRWSNSKVKNDDVEKVKKKLKREVTLGSGKKTMWLVNSLVITVVLYNFLRAVSKDIYKG